MFKRHTSACVRQVVSLFFPGMRLTAVFLTVIFLHLNTSVHSQTITIEAKNSTLQSVFKILTKQTGYSVFYNDQLLAGTKPVSVDVKNMPLKKFLGILFANQPLEYELREDIKTI